MSKSLEILSLVDITLRKQYNKIFFFFISPALHFFLDEITLYD